ncbi:MAG: MBL fold metallo-hydrolase [Defluviitaleaceae bacterium]|nr:MBL fold metallo-hydrolase [Defluviitaleaceae bacterium]
MNIKVYGCRGTVSLSHTYGSRYGGNTSCIKVESGGSVLIVDAGSGIMQMEYELRETYPDYPKGLPFNLNVLISHLHIDHIIGLPTFGPTLNPGANMKIFTCSRDERPIKEQIFGVYKPPYWPVSMAEIAAAQCVAVEPDVPFDVGPFTVTPFTAEHPDSTLSFHITDGNKVFVHLLDSEVSYMQPHAYEKLLSYCREADMVVSDAAYSSDDYQMRKGWGHSTVKDGIRLANDSGCKSMMFAHISQSYCDSTLDSWKRHIMDNRDEYILAHDGLELTL